MKKIENFANCLDVLRGANFELAQQDEIYRAGVAAQFNLTFEMAWKALQEVMRRHGIAGAQTGSPREILQLAYQCGFLKDQGVWIAMLRERNLSAHVYSEDEIDNLILLIRDSFIPAFEGLEETLREKDAEP